jgi:hypothetical protein
MTFLYSPRVKTPPPPQRKIHGAPSALQYEMETHEYKF